MRPEFYFPIFLILTSISFSEHVKEDSTKIEDEWLAFDKVQHFTYSLLWTLSTQYVLVNNMNMKEEDALPFSVISSLSAGIMKERLDTLSQANDYIGKYFSHEFVRQYILRQTEGDIETIDQQMAKEKEAGGDDNDNDNNGENW